MNPVLILFYVNVCLKYSFCFSFVGEYIDEDFRFFTAESMHIAPGYIIQFELVMGCGLPYLVNIDNRHSLV